MIRFPASVPGSLFDIHCQIRHVGVGFHIGRIIEHAPVWLEIVFGVSTINFVGKAQRAPPPLACPL